MDRLSKAFTKLFKMAALFAAILFWAVPTQAQPLIQHDRIPDPWILIKSDVTGDGIPDILASTPHSLDADVFTLELGGTDKIGTIFRFFKPTWPNHTGDSAIEVTSNTSFLLRTGCFACGRYHSFYETKVAFRDDQFWVVGYTEHSVDRIAAAISECDVNLSNGDAIVSFDVDYDRQELNSQQRRFLFSDWSSDFRPAVCDAMHKYDNEFVDTYLATKN